MTADPLDPCGLEAPPKPLKIRLTMTNEKAFYWLVLVVAVVPVQLIRAAVTAFLFARRAVRLAVRLVLAALPFASSSSSGRAKRFDVGRDHSTVLRKELTGNYNHESGGYRAGVEQYASVWTRDSFFALFAPIPERGDRMRKLCDRLRDSQNSQGLCSFVFNEVLYLPTVITVALGLGPVRRSVPLTRFTDEKWGEKVMDVNAEYVIMVHEAFLAMQQHKDEDRKAAVDFLKGHAEGVRKALSFYSDHRTPHGLVHELPFGNWEDSLKTPGPLPFTNILYLEALRRATEIFKIADDNNNDNNNNNNNNNNKGAHWLAAAAASCDKAAGRLAPIVFDLVEGDPDAVTVALAALWHADDGKTLARVRQWMQGMLAAFPRDTLPPNRWPSRPLGDCCLGLVLLGQGDYHRGFRWSLSGGLWAAGLYKAGFTADADRIVAMYDAAFAKYGTIHEVFEAWPLKETTEAEGAPSSLSFAAPIPVRRTFYQSERAFSMGIGPYLLAKHLQAKAQQ